MSVVSGSFSLLLAFFLLDSCSTHSELLGTDLAESMNHISPPNSPKWTGKLDACKMVIERKYFASCGEGQKSLATRVTINFPEVDDIFVLSSEDTSVISFAFHGDVEAAFEAAARSLEQKNGLYAGRFTSRQQAHLHAERILNEMNALSRKTARTCSLNPAVDISQM